MAYGAQAIWASFGGASCQLPTRDVFGHVPTSINWKVRGGTVPFKPPQVKWGQPPFLYPPPPSAFLIRGSRGRKMASLFEESPKWLGKAGRGAFRCLQKSNEGEKVKITSKGVKSMILHIQLCAQTAFEIYYNVYLTNITWNMSHWRNPHFHSPEDILVTVAWLLVVDNNMFYASCNSFCLKWSGSVRLINYLIATCSNTQLKSSELQVQSLWPLHKYMYRRRSLSTTAVDGGLPVANASTRGQVKRAVILPAKG